MPVRTPALGLEAISVPKRGSLWKMPGGPLSRCLRCSYDRWADCGEVSSPRWILKFEKTGPVPCQACESASAIAGLEAPIKGGQGDAQKPRRECAIPLGIPENTCNVLALEDLQRLFEGHRTRRVGLHELER